MKIGYTLFISLAFFIQAKAHRNPDKQPESSIDMLKSTTTVFFYRDEDKQRLDQYKKAVTEVWTFTPLLFANYSDIDKYDNPAYSHFALRSLVTTRSNATMSQTTVNTHKYLSLYLISSGGKKMKHEDLCRVELFSRWKNDEKLYPDEIGFFNFSPVQVAAFLKVINTDLQKNFVRDRYDQVKQPIKQILKKDTLYVPENVLINFGSMTGREGKLSGNVFANYPFPYRICSANELFNIFLNDGKGRYLFDYTKSSTDKYISIIDVKEGKLVYKVYIPLSYNLKAKDIDKILEL